MITLLIYDLNLTHTDSILYDLKDVFPETTSSVCECVSDQETASIVYSKEQCSEVHKLEKGVYYWIFINKYDIYKVTLEG